MQTILFFGVANLYVSQMLGYPLLLYQKLLGLIMFAMVVLTDQPRMKPHCARYYANTE